MVSPRGLPSRLRRRVALAFGVIVLAACGIAAALVFSRALDERQAIRERALSTAVALSFGFDQEVAAVNSLLKGLSTSPALLSGDTKGVLRPAEGNSGPGRILADPPGPRGSGYQYPAPVRRSASRHTEVPNSQEQIDRIQGPGLVGLGADRPGEGLDVIALSLRIDGPDGQMKKFITTILSEQRLSQSWPSRKYPRIGRRRVYDRSLSPSSRGGRAMDARSRALGPARAARRRRPDTVEDSFVEDVDGQRGSGLVAYRRSGATTDDRGRAHGTVNAPVRGVLWQLAGPALPPLRERPRRLVHGTPGRAAPASSLVPGDGSEGRGRQAFRAAARPSGGGAPAHCPRIARFDRPAPRRRRSWADAARVAVRQFRRRSKACDELGPCSPQRLELRIFTFLLHPPNLASDGLGATLRGVHRRVCGADRPQAHPSGSPGRSTRSAGNSTRDPAGCAGGAWPTSIAMPGRPRCTSAASRCGHLIVRVRDNGRGIGTQPSLSAGLDWASASRACGPACSSSAAI